MYPDKSITKNIQHDITIQLLRDITNQTHDLTGIITKPQGEYNIIKTVNRQENNVITTST